MISRKTAHDILAAGATPKTISSGEFNLDAYTTVLRTQIRTQVRSYIRSSFHQLKNEFVYSASNQGADDICRAYWEFADAVIRRSTENDPNMPQWPSGSSDDAYVSVQAAPGVVDVDGPKIRLKEEDGALVIIGHKLRWDDDRGIPTDAVKWHVQASYEASPMHPTPEGYVSVIVDFPWLLRAVPNEANVLRMSPAAFGILLTLITRSFFKDSVRALEMLSERDGSISSIALIDGLYDELTLSQLPDALFDAWAGYWDAD